MPDGVREWLKTIFTGANPTDYAQWQAYKEGGGGEGYFAWRSKGEPPPPAKMTPTAWWLATQAPYTLPPGAGTPTVAPISPGEAITLAEKQAGAALGTLGKPGTAALGYSLVDALTEAARLQGLYPDRQFRAQWDADSGQYYIADVTPAPAAKYPLEEGQPQTWADNSGNIWSWDEDQNGYVKVGYDPSKDVTRQEATGAAASEQAWRERQLAADEAYRRAQLQWEQQQFQEQLAYQREQTQLARQEQERQYRAQLASQPMSWLQYASYTGEPPVVQPWMLPLSYKQYGWQVGGEIPGWTAESAQGMPELMTPSAQYLARMGPTSQQQWLGYQQAKTGATPEETQFRTWSAAPPGGTYSPLRWAR